jgi:hypothetical protein
VKIYVAAVEAVGKKERQDETQFTTKIDGFLSSSPYVFFALNLAPCMTKLRVLVLRFPYFTYNSNDLFFTQPYIK